MRIHFLGAARTTTGSRHLLEVNGSRILLDCGLYQGRRADSYEVNRSFPFDPASLDGVILSHAHIDHSGNLPLLCRSGFKGNVVATFATRDLCQLMLADSAKVQAQDTIFLNKRRAKQGLPPVQPLYTPREAEQCLRQFVTVDYGRSLPVANGVTLRFFDAGHILGSAQVCLDIDELGKKRRLLFSGDVGRGNNDLLRDPFPVQDVDLMLMESTYGAREHDMTEKADERLCEIIRRAIERGGKILIPSFAVERTQQLIYALHRLRLAGTLPPVPIFVDSPLAVNATEVFRLHPECFNDATYEFLFTQHNPFGFDDITYIRELSQSKKLNDFNGTCIIISASGMCEAGRILHHLRNHIENPRTTILFVGYCAAHTLGARILKGKSPVNILGESFRVNAHIERMDSFSGHADHSELLDYFAKTGGRKERVWLVHGEPEQSDPLAHELATLHPEIQFHVPNCGEVADV
jgi:metallo-beta-lactamase family protein